MEPLDADVFGHSFGSLMAVVLALVVLVPTKAAALASTATDLTDARSGPVGKTDLRVLGVQFRLRLSTFEPC